LALPSRRQKGSTSRPGVPYLAMPSKRLVKDPERYKTVLCQKWMTTGDCPYGRKCQFAHGKEELRERNSSLSPPQPPQPGQPGMTPMMLPYASGQAGPSGVGPYANGQAGPSGMSLMGRPLPAYDTSTGLWSAPAAAPPLPLGLPPSNNATALKTHLAMPPLPPGPPPPLPPTPPVPAHESVPHESPPPLAPPPVSVYADELACFAMKCHLADDLDEACGNLPSLPCQSDLSWEPLRCNEITGKVEPVPFSADSPVEPMLGKVGRQVSYPTQVVRRAISFVFEDGPNSPVNIRRSTALAA